MINCDRSVKVLLTLLVTGVWGVFLQNLFPTPAAYAQPGPAGNSPGGKAPEVLRVRGLVVVDERGRERILIGSPVPGPKGFARRVSPATGLTINDANGHERFGVGLLEDGNMAMGLDAPSGIGNAENSERISLVADAKGGAMIRFLNSKALVPGMLRLGGDDKLYLEFWDVQPEKKKLLHRTLGLKGEETVEEPLR